MLNVNVFSPSTKTTAGSVPPTPRRVPRSRRSCRSRSGAHAVMIRALGLRRGVRGARALHLALYRGESDEAVRLQLSHPDLEGKTRSVPQVRKLPLLASHSERAPHAEGRAAEGGPRTAGEVAATAALR